MVLVHKHSKPHKNSSRVFFLVKDQGLVHYNMRKHYAMRLITWEEAKNNWCNQLWAFNLHARKMSWWGWWGHCPTIPYHFKMVKGSYKVICCYAWVQGARTTHAHNRASNNLSIMHGHLWSKSWMWGAFPWVVINAQPI